MSKIVLDIINSVCTWGVVVFMIWFSNNSIFQDMKVKKIIPHIFIVKFLISWGQIDMYYTHTSPEVVLSKFFPSFFSIFVSRWRLNCFLSLLFSLPFSSFPSSLHYPRLPWQTFVIRMDAVILKSLTVTYCLFKRTRRKWGNRFSLLKA